MPISDTNPPVCYTPWADNPDMATIDDCEVRDGPVWVVVSTRSRAERALAWRLRGVKITYMLPMAPAEVHSGGRTFLGMRVAFPGYVFVRGDAWAWHDVRGMPETAMIMNVPDQVELVGDLRRVETYLGSGALAARIAGTMKVRVGQVVRVERGPLAGVVGSVEMVRGRTVYLPINSLGMAVEVGVDMVTAEVA